MAGLEAKNNGNLLQFHGFARSPSALKTDPGPRARWLKKKPNYTRALQLYAYNNGCTIKHRKISTHTPILFRRFFRGPLRPVRSLPP